MKSASDFGANTHLRFIAELCEQGKSQREAFNALEPLVLGQIEPMIFKRNPTSSEKYAGITNRQPKPMAEQLIELRNAIGRIYGLMGRSSGTKFDDSGTEFEESQIQETTEDETDDTETESSETPKPVASGKKRIESELEKFFRRIQEVRRFCETRSATDPIDEISVRPAEAAGKLIPLGIPADAILSAISVHWTRDARQDAGIPDFDFKSLSQSIAEENDLNRKWQDLGHSDPLHDMFGYALTLARVGQPLYLWGSHGTGKSHLARQIAKFWNLPYGETPMSAGAMRGDLLGRQTANPNRAFISAKFNDIYGGGGVFNFEELDAADPSMIIVLNNALAGNELHNSASGETVLRSPNFIAVATANTLARGATAMYSARERLDGATLDRWNVGRIKLERDPKIEKYLLFDANKSRNPAREI